MNLLSTSPFSSSKFLMQHAIRCDPPPSNSFNTGLPEIFTWEMARNGAAEVLAAAAARVTDPKALAKAEKAFQSVLEGSAGGKVKVVAERGGLVAGLTALAAAPAVAWKGNADGPNLASTAACFLSSYYKCGWACSSDSLPIFSYDS
jgi:PPE-repeat protein